MEIMRSCIEEKEIKHKNYKQALVIAIVLHTVDINDYTEKELLESKSFLSKIMLLEKSESKEKFLKNLEKIIPRTNKENRDNLLRIINYTYKDYFDEKTLEQITNKIKEGGDENMLASVRMLEREKRKEERERQREFKLGEARGLEAGRKKEKISLAKKMLKENFAIEIIEKITGLRREKFM